MGFSKDQLLARLKELDINYVCYEHPVVLTVEAQAKYVGHLGGAISKNLFLKDKKHRFYIVSALMGTTVDLKVLSQRLGLGKGGLRMGPEEALQEILQVPLGCVTPFALINDSARIASLLFNSISERMIELLTRGFPHNYLNCFGFTTDTVIKALNVTLLLDQHFKAYECCFFHPLSNDVTISLNARDLDKFLVSIGKTPSYVDLEATPTVGKDQPPDLAALVPSAAIVLPDQPNQTLPSKPTTENHVLVEDKPKAVTGKTLKHSSNAQSAKEKAVDAAKPRQSGADVRTFIDEIIEKTSSLVLSQITAETIQQHGEHLGNVVSDGVQKRLSTDLERITTMFKNSAYTEGFHSGAKAGYVRGCPP